MGEGRRLDSGVDVRPCLAADAVGGEHCRAQHRQALPAGNGTKQQSARLQDQVQRGSGELKVVGRIEQANCDACIEALGTKRQAFEVRALAASALSHQRSGVDDGDPARLQSAGPFRIGATRQQDLGKFGANISEPFQAIAKGPVIEEIFGAVPGRAVATQGAELMVEQRRGHEALVRRARRGDKAAMQALLSSIGAAGSWVVDLALPPRCPSCGTITGELHSFCSECWRMIDWLGDGGCRSCGLPLEGTEIETCAACLAKPPDIARTRAAVAYRETTRTLPLRLKYSRKVALAKTMARYMAPLVNRESDAILVPVPLHRARLWSWGFNQAALIAAELARQCGLAHDPLVLRRKKRTSALKGMSPLQRRREVAGAFAIADAAAVQARNVVLIDDVLTTGSTANACAKSVLRAGARRVELICWARVVRPAQLMR